MQQDEPYLLIKKSSDGKPLEGNDGYEGYCADLAKKIAEFVGFQYTIQPVQDGKYGTKDQATGMWNGMVGELVSHVSNDS